MKSKKLLSLLLSAVMCLTLVGVLPPATAHAAGQSATATRGVYWFDTHELGQDLTDTYIFDDALFTGDGGEFNQQLATMSFELAVASISSEREAKTEAGYQNKSRNLRAYLEDNGFVDFETNEYYKKKMTTRTMGAACAHKKIVDGGKEYTLLAIVPRSAGYEAEWGGNFMINDPEDDSDTGDSYGFRNGKRIVLDFAKDYIARHGISGDVKVWTAGYSRGAGVTNQVGAALINRPADVLGSSVNLTPENLYCYTYGTPNSASTSGNGGAGTEGRYDDAGFKYIHNNWESYDIVTAAPPLGFGFNRYGTNMGYASQTRKQRMLELLRVTNPTVYDLYTNGGDPDFFELKTIDLEALLQGSFALAKDTNPYLPEGKRDQRAYMSMMGASMVKAVGSREKYSADGYQEAMEDLCGYFFSHMDRGSDLIEGIRTSRYASPMVVFMYIAYMTERYADANYDLQSLRDAITALDNRIAEIEADEGEVPQELKTELAKLKSELQTAETWDGAKEATRAIAADMYSKVIAAGLTKAGLPDENPDLYSRIIGTTESRAMSRIIAYLLLYDTEQSTENPVISFTAVSEQVKHLATFIGNASSFMRPHNNEVILSWLRANDTTYDDFVKEDDARKAGYRRVYITAPAGVKLTGTVRDGSGKQVAAFENGRLLSSTDPWVAITTSDKGNWLRLPIDQIYKVVLNTDRDTKIDLKVAEYDNYDGRETRVVEKDSNYNWKGLPMTPDDTVTLVVSQSGLVTKQGYPDKQEMRYKAMDGKARYYIEMSGFSVTQPTIHTVANVPKKAMDVSWTKVAGADGYKIAWRVAGKKWKTKKTTKLKYRVKNLKKGKLYEFKVAATKKSTDASAAKTGPYSKPMYRWYKTTSAWAAGQKKTAAVVWSKAKGATGYIVLVSTKKSMKDPRQINVKGGTKTKRTIKGLKSGKTYYVMVRPYKKKNGHRYVGITTSAKKVIVQ